MKLLWTKIEDLFYLLMCIHLLNLCEIIINCILINCVF
jgi:hypothetical protein